MSGQVKAMVYSQKHRYMFKIGLRVEAGRIKDGPLSACWKETGNGDLVIDDFFSRQMIVRDSVRATMRLDTEESRLQMTVFTTPHKSFPTARFNDKPVSGFLKTHRTIILLMESPHKDEYAQDTSTACLQPIAPANGQAGERILKYGESVFEQLPLCPSRDYCLVLCNPIPFQCSLWHLVRKSEKEGLDSKIRSAVWQDIWNCHDLGYPKYLLRRLVRYKPSFLINACASGLKSPIRKLLRQSCPGLAVWEADHPSVWKDNSMLTRVE